MWNEHSHLKSLRDDSDLGVVEVAACGEAAIPALRDMLFQREPSGLFQPRCRAVEALAALKAYHVLIEYLNASQIAADSVERLGDDAVVNAAALAVTKARDQCVFPLLLELAKRPSLTGVVSALGSFCRVEAIPLLIATLEDDASRPAAVAALKKVDLAARPALIASAKLRSPSQEHESVSSLRRRRSVLELLNEIGILRKTWPELRCLMSDADPKISMLACKLGLARANGDERRDIIRRLIGLCVDADWMLRDEIEDCVAKHFQNSCEMITRFFHASGLMDTDVATRAQIELVLLRVRERAKQRAQHDL
jgi:hypothetical protein